MTMTVKKRFIIASPFQAHDRALHSEDTVVTKSRFSRAALGAVAALRVVAALRAVAALGTVALLVVASGALARGADAAVSIVDFAFEPATITIDAGDTVTWTVTRAQDPHTVSPVHPPDAFVGSPLLHQGDHFSVTFAQPGTYRYQCTIHPEDMQGTVIVQAAESTATATPGAPQLTASPAPSTSTGVTTTVSADVGDGATEQGAPPALALLLVLGTAAVLAGAWLVVRSRRSRR
jgi:plastocyanin